MDEKNENINENIIEENDVNIKSQENENTKESESTSNEDMPNIEELMELVDAKENEAKENLDKYMRVMAEYDNFRKRTIKEKSDMYDKGIMDSVSKILDLVDNFDRASKQFKDTEFDDNGKKLYEGMLLLEKQFKQALTNIGITEIKGEGEEFNPEFHNAVTHVEDENFGENIVVEEFQKGYMYNDKVIRYSMVKVAN